MATGESTSEERTQQLLRRLDEVKQHYSKRFGGMDGPHGTDDLVFQLFHDAIYLAAHEGLDWMTIQERAADHVFATFPVPNE